jgi:hypothetical protein
MKYLEPLRQLIELLIREYGADGTLGIFGSILFFAFIVQYFRARQRRKELDTIRAMYMVNITTLERELRTYKRLHFQSLGRSEQEIELLLGEVSANPQPSVTSFWSKLKFW